MDISQGIFFQYTTKRLNLDYSQAVNLVAKNSDNTENNINNVSKEGEISVANIGSTLSDEAIENIMQTGYVQGNSEPVVRLSTTYKDFSPSEIYNIKLLIYKAHHPEYNEEGSNTNPPEGGSTTNPSDDGGNTTISGGDGDNTTISDGDSKNSFLSSDFCDTETLFEYMNAVNPEITKETGVTRAQLVEFTKNDNWEDAHYDFFGSINRIFISLDQDNDGILSYSEIDKFIGYDLGDNITTYKSEVDSYSNLIQSQYENLSNQEKLEYAIARTEEYLQAAGMDRQLAALNRLKGCQDTYNSIKVGQIAIADLNENNTSGYVTLGAYNYWAYKIQNYDNGVNVGDFEVFSHDRDFRDNDGQDYDLGITLDISLLDENWYILVNTLVHELTHATAYQYYSSDELGRIPKSTITSLYEQGALSELDYNWYISNWNRLASPSNQNDIDMLDRLRYVTSCVWGEYAAYQADADYYDSIGQDVYKNSNDDSTTAVDGPDEKNAIMNHIEASYNHYIDDEGHECNESIPDYKWWSYYA